MLMLEVMIATHSAQIQVAFFREMVYLRQGFYDVAAAESWIR